MPAGVFAIDGTTVRRSGHKKADYVLALKGNQGSLREDVELFAAEQKARDFADTEISRDTTIGGDPAESKPEPPPSSTTSNGYSSVMTGPA